MSEMQAVDTKALGRPIAKYQGAFPHGFLNWVNGLHGIYNKTVLFPFGGTTESRSGWTVNDINQDLDVDTHHDARNLPEEWTEAFEVVISDPPYSEHYAEEYYDVEYPRPKSHFVEAARCVKEGGLLLILDWLCYENYRPDELERLRPKAITTGPKQRVRLLNRYRKRNTLKSELGKMSNNGE